MKRSGFLFVVNQSHQVYIISEQDLVPIYSAFLRPVLQFQHTSRTYGRTNTASNTAGAYNILSLLRIRPYIDTHFAVGGAVTTGNALTAVGRNPEP